MRELQRKLPEIILEQQAQHFALYQRVIDQRRTDKNKVYSLHESDVYCVGKVKGLRLFDTAGHCSFAERETANSTLWTESP